MGLEMHHVAAVWEFLKNQNNHTDEVILGVDTHLDVHMGAVVSAS